MEEEKAENRPGSSHTPPTTKKLRLKPTRALQVRTDTQKTKQLKSHTELAKQLYQKKYVWTYFGFNEDNTKQKS